MKGIFLKAMILKPIKAESVVCPDTIRPLLNGAKLYDSSCSPEAQVTFIDKDSGYFLKSAPKGALEQEAVMTRFFHKKGLSANVLSYISEERDWLLTEKMRGDDCVAAKYLTQPKRLCDCLAQRLSLLHSLDYTDCPVQNHTARYLVAAENNYHAGHYDAALFPDNWGYTTPEEAYDTVKKNGHLLKTDTLLHGDYCLPNIILDDWQFSGFIDLDSGGVGDRHVDLFWAVWTLFFNLKTNQYRERFLDAYGRERVDENLLRVVAAIEVFGK